MSLARIPADQSARDAISSRLDDNLFVEAGAGTGKTTALVGRMVALVLNGQMPVESIVAITFTELAATELRDRFRQALEDRSGTETDEHLLQLLELALVDLDLAPISTLHGFARRLLAEHPLEAGLPPAFDLLDEVSSRLAFDDRWSDLRIRLLDDPDLSHTLLLAADLDITLDHLRQLAARLDDRWDLLDPGLVAPPEPTVDLGPLIEALDAITVHGRPDLPPEDRLQMRLNRVSGLRRDLAGTTDDFDRLEMLRTKALRSIIAFGNAGSASVWGETKDEVMEAKEDALLAWDATLVDVADQVLRRLLHELVIGARSAAAERRHTGTLTFHDLLVNARNLLADPVTGPPVRAALHARYGAVLLDEFQDTDPVQLDLALMIADPVSPPGSPLDQVSPSGGSIFVVGDPKQSIYRFRRADIALYLRARHSLPADAITLTRNFRTTVGVLDWINAVFGCLIQAGQGQPGYVPLEGHRPCASTGPAVTLLGSAAHGELSAGELRVLEASDVAAAITTAVADGWTVEDRDGTERACRFSDIAVLIPSRTSLTDLEDALDDASVPYRAESSSLLFGTTEVRDLLMVLRAIDDPSDDLAIVHALRTPYMGCGDDDLARWRVHHGGSWNHQADAPAAVPPGDPVASGLAWLGEVHRTRHHEGPSAILERLIVDRRVLELATATPRPREVWRRARLLADRARAFAEADGGSIRAFADWSLQQAEDGSRVTETVLPELDDDAVRILTIHGSKGLEFPITIVSGLSGGGNPGGSGLDLIFPDGGVPEVRIRKAQATNGHAAAAAVNGDFDRAERLRLLYVAATRARDHLVVSLHRTEDVDPYDKPESGATPARQLASAISSLGTDVPAADLLTTTSRALPVPISPEPRMRQDRDSWTANRQAAIHAASGHQTLAATRIAAHAAPDVPVDRARPGEAGRHGTAIGRAVHGALEHAPFDDADVSALAREHAINEGVADEAPLVGSLIRAALASDVVRAAAGSRHWRELYVAAPLVDDPDSPVVEGFIDLAYLDGRPDEPGLTIVDYKTDAVVDAADRIAKASRYRLQGATYALAAERSTGLTVQRVVFCFLSGDGSVEVDIEDLPAAMAEVTDAVRDMTGV